MDNDDLVSGEFVHVDRAADAITVADRDALDFFAFDAPFESAQVDRVGRVAHGKAVGGFAGAGNARFDLEHLTFKFDVGFVEAIDFVDVIDDGVVALRPYTFAVFLFLFPFLMGFVLAEQGFFPGGAIMVCVFFNQTSAGVFVIFVSFQFFVIIVVLVLVFFRLMFRHGFDAFIFLGFDLFGFCFGFRFDVFFFDDRFRFFFGFRRDGFLFHRLRFFLSRDIRDIEDFVHRGFFRRQSGRIEHRRGFFFFFLGCDRLRNGWLFRFRFHHFFDFLKDGERIVHIGQ